MLEAISADILQLRRLESLSICPSWTEAHGREMTVTTELSSLTSLTYLRLHGVENCSGTISAMTGLRSLHIGAGPDIFQIGDCISNLVSLTSLQVDHILIGGDIRALSSLSALQEFTSCYVGVAGTDAGRESFCKALGGLTQLTKLSISSHRWDMNTLSLSRLRKLKVLSLSCQLVAVSVCRSWTSLQSLDLSWNLLHAIPDPANLTALSSLTHLDLSAQYDGSLQVGEPMDFLGSMPQLQVLDLAKTPCNVDECVGIYWSPESLCHLTEA